MAPTITETAKAHEKPGIHEDIKTSKEQTLPPRVRKNKRSKQTRTQYSVCEKCQKQTTLPTRPESSLSFQLNGHKSRFHRQI